jgi:hypothetical protein
MVEVAKSYEMVRNFNNFKAFVMFAVKKMEALLILVGKCCSYANVSPEKNFMTVLMLVRKIFLTSPPPPPPPRRQHFRGKIVRPGQNPRKCWSKHDDTPQC